MGECVGHEPCGACGSSDNVARYDDGTGWCFGCSTYYEAGETTGETRASNPHEKHDWTPIKGHYAELRNRGLNEETLKKIGYQLGERDDEPVHIMNQYDPVTRKLIAQKFRNRDKEFAWIGESKNPPLYLQWLWPSKGKSITITEGEIDAATVLQVFSLKYPVVSLPNGCGSVKKSLTKAYEWLDGYEKIVLMFDNDDAGREALAIAVEILPAGKVYIAKLPEKDPNETLLKHGAGAITRSFWDAEIHRLDGIVEGSTFTLERVKKATAAGYEFAYPRLQEMTFGLRKRELTLLTAGSGIGKSTWAREIAYSMHQTHGLTIGNIFLEEGNDKTAQGYVALHNNVPLGELRAQPDRITDQEYESALAAVVHQRMWFYDHFGSMECNTLIKKLQYLAKVCKIDFAILDHISIVTSGLESSSEGERKDIDILMTRLQKVIQETGIGILAIVHLKRKPGVSYNEGGQVSLNDLRGSGSLEQLSDNVYALERDQQAEGDEKCKELIRVLKCRETGDTGEADEIIYDRKTGRLVLAVNHIFAAAVDSEGEGEPF